MAYETHDSKRMEALMDEPKTMVDLNEIEKRIIDSIRNGNEELKEFLKNLD